MGLVSNKRVVVREPVSNELRALVWDKSEGRCWYCGTKTNPFRDFRVDHLVPCWDGGSSEIDNLVPCCAKCNHKKGTHSLNEFRRMDTQRALSGELAFWFELQDRSLPFWSRDPW